MLLDTGGVNRNFIYTQYTVPFHHAIEQNYWVSCSNIQKNHVWWPLDRSLVQMDEKGWSIKMTFGTGWRFTMSSSTYILSVARSDLYTQIFDRIEVVKLLVVHILCLLYLRFKTSRYSLLQIASTWKQIHAFFLANAYQSIYSLSLNFENLFSFC